MYEDDIPIAAPNLKDIQWFKESFGKVFKIKDLGETQKILGMRATRDRKNGTLKLDQTHYVRDILERFHMTKEKAHLTRSPLDSYDFLRPAGPNNLRTGQREY